MIPLDKLLAATTLASAATALSVIFLSPLAKKVGLVDQPGGRKTHQGEVPLVGGISIFAGCAVGIVYSQTVIPGFHAFVTAATLLFAIGVIDDYQDISAKLKLLGQVLAAWIMVTWGGLRIDGLSNLFMPGSFELGVFAAPFTVLAVVGYINAINMTDGVDGLAGSLTGVSAVALLVICLITGRTVEATYLSLFSASVLVFLIFNARHPLRRRAGIFLGDAGSMLCGFVICWFVIRLATDKPRSIDAATALWIVGLPFIDLVSVMMKRVLKRRSPFSADREHIHHMLLVAGYTVNQTVLTITGVAAAFSATGVLGLYMNVPGYWMFYAFCMAFIAVMIILMKAWKFTKVLRHIRERLFRNP